MMNVEDLAVILGKNHLQPLDIRAVAINKALILDGDLEVAARVAMSRGAVR